MLRSRWLIMVLLAAGTAVLRAEPVIVSGVELQWLLPEDSGRVVHTTGPAVYRAIEFHDSLKLAALIGTPVYCPLGGQVVATGIGSEGLGEIVISHEPGVFTVYRGLMDIYPVSGDPVETGEMLGRIGVDADSDTGALYFQLWIESQLVDPLPALWDNMPAAVRDRAARDTGIMRSRVEDFLSR